MKETTTETEPAPGLQTARRPGPWSRLDGLPTLATQATFQPVGDFFQVLADVEATEIEAPALADSLVRWLAGEDVIMKGQTDCVLSADAGYPPGPSFRTAVIEPHDDRFLTLRNNGVDVSTGRQVFDPGQGELGAVTCPRCGLVVQLSDPETGSPADQWEPFSDALGSWYAGGPGQVRCPHCSVSTDFNDWLWGGRPFAVGFLGLTFWNWPELSAQFVQRVADHLGHRIVLAGGKL